MAMNYTFKEYEALKRKQFNKGAIFLVRDALIVLAILAVFILIAMGDNITGGVNTL